MVNRSLSLLITLLGCFAAIVSTTASSKYEEQVQSFLTSSTTGHTNNWAVLVCSSRYWFNYRHVSNVLSLYRSVKRLGIPDSRIILMLADDMACNARNPKPATVFNNAYHHINVYGDDVEVDYRGYEVTVENFIRLLTGRVTPSTPKSQRLMTDSGSNILIYMTGHGGDGFLKFQDSEEITSIELADAFEQMRQKGRYHEILLITETCQAESMAAKLYSPNILAVGSSKIGEDSLSHHGDPTIGVYIIDRYTYYALEFLEKVTINSTKSVGQFLTDVCPKRLCISTVSVRSDLFRRNPQSVALTDFFGNIPHVDLISINADDESEKVRMASRQRSRSHPDKPETIIDDGVGVNDRRIEKENLIRSPASARSQSSPLSWAAFDHSSIF